MVSTAKINKNTFKKTRKVSYVTFAENESEKKRKIGAAGRRMGMDSRFWRGTGQCEYLLLLIKKNTRLSLSLYLSFFLSFPLLGKDSI